MPSSSIIIVQDLQVVVFLLILLIASSSTTTTSTSSIAKPGCRDSCRNISVPYPFGIGSPTCYYDKAFEIKCSDSKGPLLLLNSLWSEVLQLTLDYVRFNAWSLSNCYNKTTGNGEWLIHPLPYLTDDGPFTFSSTRSIFTAVGCDIFAYIPSEDSQNYLSGCASFCANSTVGNLSSCSGGNGCCQTTIPKGLKSFLIRVESINTYNRSWISNPCSHAIVVDREFSGFNDLMLSDENISHVPMILDWAIGSITCKEAQRDPTSYACGHNTYCFESDNGPGAGYRCNCSKGYTGNPYLLHGCQDINECKESSQSTSCLKEAICINTPGSYSCACPRGYHGDGKILGIGCMADKQRLHVAVVVSLGKGGFGTVYKGMLSDGRIVAIKKSKLVDESQVDQFINEVVILSQINHRHIVKLLGCCLETQVPLLAYEFVSNGTLSYLLHGEGIGHQSLLSWKDRLRIAGEVAGALAYLHSDTSIPIFHRDMKSSNILLDENYRAKVSDFGISRSIPVDKTHITTLVQGTFGYLDPEYFRSGQFTEKSDVYSFGVVLVELLTGEKAISILRFEEDMNLAFYFTSSMKKNQLFEILDARVVSEGDKDEIWVVAKLAKRCLKLNGKKRPIMKEVVANLNGLRMFQEHPWIDKQKFQAEEEYMKLGDQKSSCYISSTSAVGGFESSTFEAR
ncbi:Protein kinase domain [Macleaya cordata]|uniref:Protein kinase domain n=1 Tax=Macleaya cordata TaxID=56857 RepID=A0A200R893_MACCD|nr:Protein kinase domain [Macleaya cordata]